MSCPPLSVRRYIRSKLSVSKRVQCPVYRDLSHDRIDPGLHDKTEAGLRLDFDYNSDHNYDYDHDYDYDYN